VSVSPPPLAGSTLALLVIYADLDNMKPINDTHGHESGDQALIEVADILGTRLRVRPRRPARRRRVLCPAGRCRGRGRPTR
jgi:predicted signal transduction protein with EAL and GGDEF domain